MSYMALQAELSVVEAFGAGTDHGQEKVGELTAAAEAIKEKRLKLRETQMTLDGSSTLQVCSALVETCKASTQLTYAT